jgi:hypothetical protein
VLILDKLEKGIGVALEVGIVVFGDNVRQRKPQNVGSPQITHLFVQGREVNVGLDLETVHHEHANVHQHHEIQSLEIERLFANNSKQEEKTENKSEKRKTVNKYVLKEDQHK